VKTTPHPRFSSHTTRYTLGIMKGGSSTLEETTFTENGSIITDSTHKWMWEMDGEKLTLRWPGNPDNTRVFQINERGIAGFKKRP
jgi:hypothetical protein